MEMQPVAHVKIVRQPGQRQHTYISMFLPAFNDNYVQFNEPLKLHVMLLSDVIA